MSNFILSEGLFAVVWLISLFIIREFWIAKDGMLRKLMIAYFAVEFYTYFGASVYYLCVHRGWWVPNNDLYRVIIILPKVVIKLLVLRWLLTGRKD